jgi:lipid II:glycine glycyltransferase (peptidoglycan interpeptide bridge formation enzyme)
MISFERIETEKINYEDINQIGEVNVFQTSAWLNFIAEVQNAESVIAAVKSDGRCLGYFTGLISHIFGLRILGSPPKGPLTYYMGFNLIAGAPKSEILEALPGFAFKDLGCHYLEVIDPNLLPGDWEGLSYRAENLHHYGIDLSKSEEELFANMDSKGRNKIRQSIKNGVVIEEASDLDFANDYYAQFEEVLAKQSLTTTYSLNSLRKLIEYNLPTGNLLLLRARDPEGRCIATGIFIGFNQMAVVWGTASWRQYQSLRPNEPIAWYGMKAMKARGIQLLHYGGKAEQYKEKLGATELQMHRLMQAKHKLFGLILYPLMSPKNDQFRKYRNWVLRKVRFYKDNEMHK